MAGRRQSEADRLARCRSIFERAQRDGVTMDEAKQRATAERIAAARAAHNAIRRRMADAPTFYWQKGQYE